MKITCIFVHSHILKIYYSSSFYMNKVLEFRILGEPTQKSSDSSLVQEQQSAIVRELIKPGLILHFYDERLIYGDIVAKDFFAMLIDSGSVTIVNEGADVTFDSMLFVKK